MMHAIVGNRTIASRHSRVLARGKRGVRRVICKICPSTPDTTVAARRTRILADNQINVVVDAGAHVGDYALALRNAGYAGRIVSFEPLTAAFAALARSASNDVDWDVLQLALGEQDGTADLNVSGNPQSSSLLPMGDAHVASLPTSVYVATEVVKVKRLDAIWAGFARGDERVWLKLDVQGFERHVIEGAKAILPLIQVIEVELSLVPLYEGQPLFREMIDYLDSLAFDLISLERGYTDRLSGHVLQVDGIFLRRT